MGLGFASEEELSAPRSGHGTEASAVPGEDYRDIEACESKTPSSFARVQFPFQIYFQKA